MSKALYESAQAAQAAGASQDAQPGAGANPNDDAIDAEFEVK